ncbi:hypothetical protein ACIP5Y_14930 [Nocardia sp. NPDC088792]|uniref:hypothetical protein n=1 Tax=Nocardia sp. NPDC088792 TaxID=3364332 RepID=UPI0037FF45E3
MSGNSDIRVGVVRGIQYGLVEEADNFTPLVRKLGAGGVRVFFYWSQLEPEPGRYDWSVVDAVLEQSDADTELWFTITAASPWGSTRSTDFLPASTPHDPAGYAALVRALVEHCGGRVRYWQCENEPSNRLFWADSAADYVRHLIRFHAAVKAADPLAEVVLGGCAPGVFADLDEPDPERDFFRHVISTCGEHYDLFDLHLYGDPYLVPVMIGNARAALRAAGYEKPVVVGEYNGPLLIEFPELFGQLTDVLATDPMRPWHAMTVADFRAQRTTTPEARAAMERLYERMPELPSALQMFMHGCPPEAEAERHRLNADDIVIRNILALSCGIDRTFCWQLGPDTPEPSEWYSFLGLLFLKFALFGYDEDRRPVRYPCASAFTELAFRLDGAKAVERITVPERPDAYIYDIAGTEWQVGWLRRDHPAVEPEPLVWNNTKLGPRPIYLRANH